jgi:hypothetical protein
MATDSIITLERLHCIRESDASGHSEPYIWPALLWIDDNTLSTPELVGVTTPALGNARVVIKNDMRAGETADIPTSVGVLRVRFEDGLSVRRLILAVALWEEDETPEAAMRAGFLAFSSELRAALADNLFALSQASEEELDAIIENVKSRVKQRVRSAIENGLTGWQKTRVFVGTLNLDDIVDSGFKHVADFLPTPITLAFRAGSSEAYEIQGTLQVRPVPVDRCQAQVNAVKTAQSAVNAVDAAIQALQAELQHASPSEKPFIISEIKRLREEELAVAQAVLSGALRALSICRSRVPPTFPQEAEIVTGSVDGPQVGVDEREILGFKTKTYFSESEHIEVTIASDGKTTIVAVPKTAISRRNQMGDDEYKCLKGCKDIADVQERLNCILRCPVTKEYHISIF